MSFKGIDVRQSGDRIIVRASLKDNTGTKVTSGTTSLFLFELQSDGTLKSYDFADNTFKTTALTTASAAMTHQTGNNATYNTGVWTYALTTLTGFTRGNIYIAQVNNATASPAYQEREFQYGEGEGDFTVNGSGQALVQPGTASGQISMTAGIANVNTVQVNGQAATQQTINTDGSGNVIPTGADGLTWASFGELMIALATGKTTYTDNGNGTGTLVFYKQDGVTTKYSVTFNTTTGARTAVSLLH